MRVPTLFILTLLAASAARAAVYASREEALSRAFPPPASVERKTYFLTEGQRELASRQAQSKIESALAIAYVGMRDGNPLGSVYFDTHTVRTMPETLLVLVLPDGRLGRVEVLSFAEPEDYLPRTAWLRLFEGRRLDSDLSVGRGLAHVTGATLTTGAIASAVRRVLAIHAIVAGSVQ